MAKRKRNSSSKDNDFGIDPEEFQESIKALAKQPPFIQIIILSFMVWVFGFMIGSFYPSKAFITYLIGYLMIGGLYGSLAFINYNKGTKLTDFFFKPTNWIQDKPVKKKRKKIPPLSSNKVIKLKEAFNYECARPKCDNSLSLDVHHIIPRSEPDSSNKWNNLILLCKNCHDKADRGMWSRKELRYWSKQARKKHKSKGGG